MRTMELSESEARVIEEMRERDTVEKVFNARILETLRTAYEYENWLQKNGAGSSYSTFCDDFGYGAGNSTLFSEVEQVRKFARTVTI